MMMESVRHGVMRACLLAAVAVAVTAVNDAGQSESWHGIQAQSEAVDDHTDFSHRMCSVDRRTASVRCANSSLAEIPAHLPASTKTLDLSYNQITHVTGVHLGRLLSVEVISLRNNMLAEVSDDAFVRCVSLRSLYLDHNVMTSLSFVGKTHLRELHISFNRIAVLDAGNTVLPLTILNLSFNSLHQFNSNLLSSSLRNVRMLNLSHNLIETVLFEDSSALSLSSVNYFDVSANRLATFELCSDCYVYSLQYVDLSSNHLLTVDSSWCELLPNLTMLDVSENPISSVASGTFRQCSSLHTLHLSSLLIRQIDSGMFKGLAHLRTLKLDHNSYLVSLQQHSFRDLPELAELYLNGCSLTTLEPETLLSPLSLLVVDLGDNPWNCNCEADVIQQLSILSARGVHVTEGTVCAEPQLVKGHYIPNISLERDECLTAGSQPIQRTVWAHVGTDLLINCSATADHPLNITWFSKRNGNTVPVTRMDIRDHAEELANLSLDMLVLHNGSLYIRSVSRASAGVYYCIVFSEYDNSTVVFSVRLNSDAISTATLYSIIVGLLSAAGFFLVAVVTGIVRYLAYLCSKKERRKRKSIRAVLESIQDYKCAQFDRFSAYRTAKMDQLSAYKSAKIEQLSAYRDARVDKLRRYKQDTVASILTHIERMREHYAAQTARIKDNCAQQAERLRDRYAVRRGRFRNYRSHQVDKMRENYAAQAVRIREYGMIQMSRLREQYKTQQQHVLKLVELLDVGSCVSGVIEAECMKAESMIFDADIAFDFEAQPARANESMIGTAADAASELSHYGTASDSDLSVSSEDYDVTCIADISVTVNENATTDSDEIAGVLAVADDVLQHMVLDEQESISENQEVPTSPWNEQTSEPSEQEMTFVKQSSSDKTPKNSVGCVELAGVTDDVDFSERVDDIAEQDTSC